MMVSIINEAQRDNVAIEHWWLVVQSRYRLFFKLLNESPQNLAQLNCLDTVIKKIEAEYRRFLLADFPYVAVEFRDYFLSAQRYFLSYLRTIRAQQIEQGEMYLNLAIADLSMLQFMFMERGIKSII